MTTEEIIDLIKTRPTKVVVVEYSQKRISLLSKKQDEWEELYLRNHEFFLNNGKGKVEFTDQMDRIHLEVKHLREDLGIWYEAESAEEVGSANSTRWEGKIDIAKYFRMKCEGKKR